MGFCGKCHRMMITSENRVYSRMTAVVYFRKNVNVLKFQGGYVTESFKDVSDHVSKYWCTHLSMSLYTSLNVAVVSAVTSLQKSLYLSTYDVPTAKSICSVVYSSKCQRECFSHTMLVDVLSPETDDFPGGVATCENLSPCLSEPVSH